MLRLGHLARCVRTVTRMRCINVDIGGKNEYKQAGSVILRALTTSSARRKAAQGTRAAGSKDGGADNEYARWKAQQDEPLKVFKPPPKVDGMYPEEIALGRKISHVALRKLGITLVLVGGVMYWINTWTDRYAAYHPSEEDLLAEAKLFDVEDARFKNRDYPPWERNEYGLYYRDIIVGQGDGPVIEGKGVVSFFYECYGLGAGLQFTWDDGDRIQDVPLDSKAAPVGLETAFVGMHCGGIREVVMPSRLGYGKSGGLATNYQLTKVEPVPGNLDLVWTIELMEYTP